jgi:hypothetical protein
MENNPAKNLGHMTFSNEIVIFLNEKICVIKKILKYFTLQTY